MHSQIWYDAKTANHYLKKNEILTSQKLLLAFSHEDLGFRLQKKKK